LNATRSPQDNPLRCTVPHQSLLIAHKQSFIIVADIHRSTYQLNRTFGYLSKRDSRGGAKE
jgi:hypothetical protein